jgi:hypothetical protein
MLMSCHDYGPSFVVFFLFFFFLVIRGVVSSFCFNIYLYFVYLTSDFFFIIPIDELNHLLVEDVTVRPVR